MTEQSTQRAAVLALLRRYHVAYASVEELEDGRVLVVSNDSRTPGTLLRLFNKEAEFGGVLYGFNAATGRESFWFYRRKK